MNLNIRQANATKSYVVTDVCTTRPRIVIKDGNNVSYLPLTTSAKQGFGLRNKVNGVNYRPLEYQSMSTSATYYTTAVASNGLSSTTALTRSSTSQTVYHTCSSTSGTSYLTRSSTSGTSYLTQYGTDVTCQQTVFRNRTTASVWASRTCVDKFTAYDNKTFKSSYSVSYGNGSYNGTTPLTFGIQTGGYNGRYYQSFTLTYPYFNNYFTYGYNSWTSSTETYGRSPYTQSVTNIARFDYNPNAFVTSSDYFSSSAPFVDVMNTSYTSVSKTTLSITADWYTVTVDNYTSFTRGFTKFTTGTSYLTRSSTSATSYLTRSSTSRTEYKTRSSTSGYSGVSSSSSETSGWQ